MEEKNDIRSNLHSINLTRKTPESYVLKLAESCSKCGHCCRYGSGIFLDDDIDRISSHMGIDKHKFIERFLDENEQFNKKVHKAKLKKKDPELPFGSCTFHDEKEGCVIHDVKPIHCRVGNGCSQHGEQLSIWFALNHLVDQKDPEAVRQWAQYLKTHPTIPGGELHELVPDKERLAKILSYEILK